MLSSLTNRVPVILPSILLVILSSCETIAVMSCYLARTVQDEGEIRKLGFSDNVSEKTPKYLAMYDVEKHVMREEKRENQLDLQRVQTSRSKTVTKSD